MCEGAMGGGCDHSVTAATSRLNYPRNNRFPPLAFRHGVFDNHSAVQYGGFAGTRTSPDTTRGARKRTPWVCVRI